jgi:tetratricopeptide (TPR) repeat protein
MTIGNQANIIKHKLAVASVRKVDDPLKFAHRIRHLGDAYYYAGQPSLAEPCYVEALSIYRQHEDRKPLDFANAIRSFAVIKDEAGALEEAERLWQEAHDLYVSVEVWQGVAESTARLALLARRQGDQQRSRKWLNEAITAADRTDDPEILQYIREVRAQFES